VTRTTPPLVGRNRQLDWLERDLHDAMRGRPHVVLVMGDAGIGKTRLLTELRLMAARCRMQVYAGRCYEDVTLPYRPFVETLTAQLGQAAGDLEGLLGADAAIVNRLLGRGSAPPQRNAPAGPAETEEDKLRLFLTLSRTIIKAAQQNATLLVFDDLHWADRSSLDLFAHLVFAASDAALQGGLPLMIVGGCRPVEPSESLARVLARLQREPVCETLELSGLGEFEVEELIRSLGVVRPAHQLVATVIEATRGNPLFIQEVMRDLDRRGALGEQGGYVVTKRSAADLHLPDQVTSLIAARIAALSEDCRRVCTLAAFLGDSFSLEALSAVTGLKAEELLDLLEEALRHRLLVSEGQTFQAAHPLIRHVLYREPSTLRSQRLHLQIATTLEALHAAELDEHVLEIAHHLARAGPVAPANKVVEYARRAGARAFAMYAWEDAARHYEAALAAASASGAPLVERADLHYRAGLAHYRNWDTGPCLDNFAKAIDAYRESRDRLGLARALMQHAQARYTLASVPYGSLIDVQPLEETLAALGDREPGLLARIQVILSGVYWTARQPEKAVEVAQRALDVGGRLGDVRLCTDASVALALAQTQGMRVEEALESYQRALQYARTAGDLLLQGRPLQRIPGALTRLGRLAEAETLAAEGCELSCKAHNWGEYSLALSARVYLAVARGDFEDAEHHARETMMMVRRSRYPWGGAEALPELACARALQGRWSEAADAVDILVEPGRVFDEPGPSIQILAWIYRQLLRASAGDVDAVRAQFAAGPLHQRRDRDDDIYSLAARCALVEIADVIAEPALAARQYDLLALAAERGVQFSVGWVFLIPRVLGVAATANGWWDRAEAHFHAAVAAANDAGARPELARCYVDFARFLALRNHAADRQRASELLQQADAIARPLGMQPLTARARRLAGEIGVALTVEGEERTDELTPHEIEILRQVVRGRGDQDVADFLVLSPASVARQVRSICGKLGLEGRGALAAYALERGLGAAALPAMGDLIAEPPAVTGPRGTETQPLVILFTDMAGSTSLLQRLGDAQARDVLRVHNAILRECLRAHRGTEIQHTGDGIFASFVSPSAAIDCAVAMQRTFADHNRDHPEVPIAVRIGLNAGEPIADDRRLVGAAVNATARICARAKPGEILVSEVVRQLVAGKSVPFVDRGRVTLKGFAERFHLYSVLWEKGGANREN
jgi:class 3 adenylate cyclase/tetratricopeptide (TPR) repeat protein